MATPGWGNAIAIPGTVSLNAGNEAHVTSISCPAPGSCAAVGDYAQNGFGKQQAFLVNRVNGTWRTAREIPGTGELNTGGVAESTGVSCASAGNCSATGGYAAGKGSRGQGRSFLADQLNGIWHIARRASEPVNSVGGAFLNAISCPSTGNCSAVGDYIDSHGQDAFVISQVHGTWGSAEQMPGFAALNQGGSSTDLVSCASPGNCSAGGYFTDGSFAVQAFVVDQVNGTWGAAREVPGTAYLNDGGFATLDSISCPSPGNCGAVGNYSDSSGIQHAFTIDRVNGAWRTARPLPGAAALPGGHAGASVISCASAGNCSAGGVSFDSAFTFNQAFVASEVNGIWRNPVELPGSGALNAGGFASIAAISCATPANCSAGGDYTDASGNQEPLVATQVNGAWKRAIEIPGIRTLNVGGISFVTALSCATPVHCSAVGGYANQTGGQVFVADQN